MDVVFPKNVLLCYSQGQKDKKNEGKSHVTVSLQSSLPKLATTISFQAFHT